MSILVVSDWVRYSELKDRLSLTDGNLASHVGALEKLTYLKVQKEFVGKRPQTSYCLTSKGRRAFEEHLDGLELLLKGGQ